MKNQNTSGSTNPQDDSIWQIVKPTNTWTPDTDKAWQKVSLNLGASAVSTSVFSAMRIKTITKFSVKKLVLWGAVFTSIAAGSMYQVLRYKQKTSLKVTAKATTQTVANMQSTIAKKTENAREATFLASPKLAKSSYQKVDDVHSQAKAKPLSNSKILQFKQTELQVVAEILSQAYGVLVKIEKPQLLHCKLTATFENEPLQNIIEIIQETFNMEIHVEKETVWLKGGSCQ